MAHGIAQWPELRGLGFGLAISCSLHLAIFAGMPQGEWISALGGRAPPALEVRLDRETASVVASSGTKGDSSTTLASVKPEEENSAGGGGVVGLPSIELVGPPYPAPSPRYYPSSSLEVLPQIASPVDLSPREVAGELRPGRVVLILLVAADGDVDDVLVESSGLSDEFTKLAVQSFRRARFSPGERKGMAVPVRVRIEITSDFQRSLSKDGSS